MMEGLANAMVVIVLQYINQINTSHTLNLQHVLRQLYLQKAAEKTLLPFS